MKKIITLLCAATLFFLSSCSQDLGSEGSPAALKSRSSEDANIKALSYLELKGDYYVLALSEAKATELGILEADFVRMKKEVEQANAWIVEFKAQFPDADLNLVNPRNVEITELRTTPLLKTRSETSTTFSITLQPYDHNAITSSKFIPSGTGELTVSCWSTGLLQAFNYSVTTLGNTVTGGGVGALGSHSSTITPSASNTIGSFMFKTANTNGGSCTFKK